MRIELNSPGLDKRMNKNKKDNRPKIESTDSIKPIDQLIQIMEQLRDPNSGCLWDIEQTFETIAPYTIEEAYEVVDAINRQNSDDLKEELGDLLLQVIFLSQIAAEENLFTFDDVSSHISQKMIRRHPHVFESLKFNDINEQNKNWEQHKTNERKAKNPNAGTLDGVAIALPSLVRAYKIQKRAAQVGFDWPDVNGAFNKLHEEISELKEEIDKPAREEDRLIDEIGDCLFSIVNVARKLGIDPDEALRKGNEKFQSRFRFMESTLESSEINIKDVSLIELEALWKKTKNTLKNK